MTDQCVPLGLADFEALDNSLRAHRSAALLVIGAPEPMVEFQKDLVAAAKRLGFVTVGPGSYSVKLQPGGRAHLCWEAEKAATRH